MTKRCRSPGACFTPVLLRRTDSKDTPNKNDTLPRATLRTEARLNVASQRVPWFVDLTEDDPGGACCFKLHTHNIWSRNKVTKAMCAVRHAHSALVRRGMFTFDNIRLENTGPAHEDPMGTLVAAMTVLKWHLNYQHLLEHNLNYETRLLCAASLFLTHKLKSEDGWGLRRCVPTSVCVLMEFLSEGDVFAHSWSKQKHDMFATEIRMLNGSPVHSLADENVQSATEMALSKLLQHGVIDEDTADAALRRVFMYFYAASVLPDRDIFEGAMRDMSMGQIGQAMARTVLRGTPTHTLLDGLPLPVLAFSELLVECLQTAPQVACIDNEFLKAMHEAEQKRVGVDCVVLPPSFFESSAARRTTVTHILVDC